MIGFLIFYFIFSGLVIGGLFAAECDVVVAFFPFFLVGWLLFPILLGLALQKVKHL